MTIRLATAAGGAKSMVGDSVRTSDQHGTASGRRTLWISSGWRDFALNAWMFLHESGVLLKYDHAQEAFRPVAQPLTLI